MGRRGDLTAIAATAAAACTIAFIGVSNASGLAVGPVRLTLTPGHPTESLSIVSNESATTILQTHSYRWTQDRGVDTLSTTSDLIIGPPIFSLGPGEQQIIRVGLRRPIVTAAEQTYRIVVAEVPSQTIRTGGLNFALRVSLPIFIPPSDAPTVSVEWSAKAVDANHISLTLHNAGNVHVQVIALRLSPENGGDPYYNAQLAKYVLSGQSFSWTLKLTRRLQGGTLSLDASSDQGRLRSTVRLPAP